MLKRAVGKLKRIKGADDRKEVFSTSAEQFPIPQSAVQETQDKIEWPKQIGNHLALQGIFQEQQVE